MVKNDPLLALVEFSTSFNPEDLKTVIGLLKGIVANVEASMEDDLKD